MVSLVEQATSGFGRALTTLGICLVMGIVGYVIYQVYFHPLARFPGLFLASVTDLWQVHQVLTLKQPYKLTDLHAKYGQFVRYGPDKLSVTAEDAIPSVYQKGGRTMPKTEYYDAFGAAHPNKHSIRRRHMSHSFARSYVKEMEKYLDENIVILRKRISEYADSGESFNLKKFFQFYTVDVLGELAFSQSFGIQLADDETLVPPVIEHSLLAAVTGSWPKMISTLRTWLPKKPHKGLQTLLEGRAACASLAARCVQRRIAALREARLQSSDEQRKDILTNIILAKDPETANRSRDGGVWFHVAYSVTEVEASLPFLRQCVKENFRNTPVFTMPLARRVMAPEGIIIAGAHIEQGTSVAVCNHAFHHDPKIWGTDHDVFDPDRWEHPENAKRSRYLMHFGLGGRQCIGKTVAQTKIYKLAGTLLTGDTSLYFNNPRNNTTQDFPVVPSASSPPDASPDIPNKPTPSSMTEPSLPPHREDLGPAWAEIAHSEDASSEAQPRTRRAKHREDLGPAWAEVAHSEDASPEAQPRTRRAKHLWQNSNRSQAPVWAALATVLASIIILSITPHLPAHVADTALRCWDAFSLGRADSRFVATRHVTLAIDDQINSLIDLYAPLMSTSTPLLKFGIGLYGLADEDTGTSRARLGGPEDNLEEWNLVLTRKRAMEICFSPLMEGSEIHSDPADVCNALQRRLFSAREKQSDVAHSLASPHTVVLWLHHVSFKFLRLFYTLQAISERPELDTSNHIDGSGTTDHAATDHAAVEMRSRTAKALYEHVDEGGPWQSVNKKIRATLLLLRQDCEDIADNLEKLYLYYDQAVISLGRRDGERSSSVGPFMPKPVPLAHIVSMISAIDDCVAVVDAVDEGLLQLRTLLSSMKRSKWETEELIDGVRVRTHFGLPAPQAILESVFKRLRRMIVEASELQEAWSIVREKEKIIREKERSERKRARGGRPGGTQV
ncbi:hypothetical protein diail_7644 [Diaporthe ilicicola]|nr:hypothetical protein diail_7644 [Diaporthe ilicicola]